MASPVVVEAWRNREYVLDLYSRMLRDRIIVLDTAIEDWTDIQIHAQEITRLKGLLTDILAEHSRMGREELEPMLDRDTFLSPQEALDLGIIDNIIKKR